MSELTLSGLDGGNPLGFLAALGTLRMAASVSTVGSATMRWEIVQGAWRPVLRVASEEDVDEDSFAKAVHHHLQRPQEVAALQLGDNLNLHHAEFRKSCLRAALDATPDNRTEVDYLSAFGCDAVRAMTGGKLGDEMADTELRTMSGAGHQNFLAVMRALAADTMSGHIRRSLFETWTHSDPAQGHSLRWDPMDIVSHALRARDPSGDPLRAQRGAIWGANRLAIAAMPMLPTMPVAGSRLATTGFSVSRESGVIWTWPLWNCHLSVDVVKSLLAHPELQSSALRRDRLASLGVIEVFRSRRVTEDKFRNFTSAAPVH